MNEQTRRRSRSDYTWIVSREPAESAILLFHFSFIHLLTCRLYHAVT